MATVKAKFRPATEPLRMGKIYYQIIHRREVKRITSGITLFPAEWDPENCAVRICCAARAKAVKAAAFALKSDLDLLKRVVNRLDNRGNEYSVADIAAIFLHRKSAPSFLDLVQREISRKIALGREGTAHNYQSAYGSFSAFLGSREIAPEEVTGELMESYQAWLRSRGLSNNSVSFYMRILRCVYNHAVKKGHTLDRRPFDTVYTGIEKTRKRAIPEAAIRKVKNLNLANCPALERARDLFMLSFYCMGISFVDLATLKKGNVSGGRLVYRRAKTGQTISVALHPKMSSLFRKYSSAKESPYLLDIVKDPQQNVRLQYQKELNVVNRNLKKVGQMAGLATTLTTYVSRHSWASIARSKNVGISTISDALGHENESTTQIYLASLDTGHVDKANELILRGL